MRPCPILGLGLIFLISRHLYLATEGLTSQIHKYRNTSFIVMKEWTICFFLGVKLHLSISLWITETGHGTDFLLLHICVVIRNKNTTWTRTKMFCMYMTKVKADKLMHVYMQYIMGDIYVYIQKHVWCFQMQPLRSHKAL